MVNQSRRRFLKAAAVAPMAATVGCATQVPLRELDYAEGINLSSPKLGSPPVFNKQDVIDNLGVAMLPEMYEHRVLITKQATHEQTMQFMRERMPENSEVTLIRHGHTTAVLVYRPDKHKLTIAFDGTQEREDIIDSFKFLGVNHALGGSVHWGYHDAIALTGDKNHPEKLSDHLKQVVASYAERDGKLDLTLTGFSRGGALATALAAEWFSEGIPGGDKTQLSNVQTFAGMPYGKGDFIAGFEKAARQHGTKLTQIIAGADNVPFLTEYTPSPYKTAGDIVFLLPNKDANITDVLVNPPKEELKIRQSMLEKRNWHDLNMYARLFGERDAYIEYDVAQERQPLEAQLGRAQTEMQRRAVKGKSDILR